MTPRECCTGDCDQGRKCHLRTRQPEQRQSVERRSWRWWLDALFAPGLVSRRRGERRDGWDRRTRADNTLKDS